MEDQRIIRLLWQRTEQGLELLAKKFGKGLYRLAMNILSNPPDAEEAVNDTYLAVWHAIPPEKPDPLSAYVYRIGRNTALKHLRQLSAQKRDSRYDISLNELAECLSACTLEDVLDARMLGHAIDQFLAGQSRQNRVIFLRRYWFGDSVQDIAVLFDMRPGSVSVRLSRIREALRAHLQKEGFSI